jgi:hypothetical protein
MRLRWIVLGVVAAIVAAAGYFGWRTAVAADVGAAAIAKVACSCVFIDGRSLASCRADDPPGFEDVNVRIDEAGKSATGIVLGLVKRRATYQDGYGCVLEP